MEPKGSITGTYQKCYIPEAHAGSIMALWNLVFSWYTCKVFIHKPLYVEIHKNRRKKKNNIGYSAYDTTAQPQPCDIEQKTS